MQALSMWLLKGTIATMMWFRVTEENVSYSINLPIGFKLIISKLIKIFNKMSFLNLV